MSVEFGGGSTGDDRMPEALRGAGYDVFGYLYERWAARLFDYCLVAMADEVAAVIAVQDTLAAADAQIDKLPDPDRLRLLLYSAAHRRCLGKLPRRRARPAPSSRTTTLDEVFARQVGTADGVTPSAGRDVLPVVAAALAGLPERDREVLNLAFRHGIEGGDLAAVVGVSARRARAMLSDARTRFQQSAAVTAALRGDLRGCEALEAITGKRHPAPPLTPEGRELVTRHVESCGVCAGRGGDQVFAAEMLSAIPLATPPLTLRMRMTGPAAAPGSHRRAGDGRASPSGSNLTKSKSRRGGQHARVVPLLALIVLAGAGAAIYELVSTAPTGPRAAPEASRNPVPAAASSLPPATLGPRGSVPERQGGPSPALPGRTLLGELTNPTAPTTGSTHTTPTSAHTTPASTHTTKPTTAPPTTPPATSTPTPTISPTPTPTSSGSPSPSG
jgi:DNA-directed RNA polymerase specialized sigma24 family protein